MVVLDDFLVKSRNLYQNKRRTFYLVGFVGYVVLIHVLMLPAYVGELGWDTIHVILLFIWFLVGALLTIATSGIALIVIGVIFLVTEWIQLNVFSLFLPAWFFKGIWGKLSYTWAMGLLLLPMVLIFIRLAWQGEKEAIKNRENINND